jgi:mannose-6-phosphate isomerase-like protein (cupin superfamily)
LKSRTVLSIVVYSNFSGAEGKVREMKKMEAKSMDHPDEVRSFDKGRVELVKIGGATVGRAIFQPGWKWSESLKPLVKTKSCEAPHFQYHVSGTLRVKMDDGTEVDLKAGDVSLLPSGHDAWVVGNEPVVVVDFQGMIDYAKGKTKK